MSSSLLQLVRDTDTQYRQQQQRQLHLQRHSSVQPSSPTTSNPFPVHNTSILTLSPAPRSPTHSYSHLSPRSIQQSAAEDEWVGGYKRRVKAAFDENMRRMEVRMEERIEELREEMRAEMQREVRRLASRSGGKLGRDEESKEQLAGREDETAREEIERLRQQVRELKKRMVQVLVREETREKQADDTQHLLQQVLGQPSTLTFDVSASVSAVKQDVTAQQAQLDRLDRQLAQLSHTTSASPLTLHAASNTLGAAASAVWPSGLGLEATASASQTLSTRLVRLETEMTSVAHALNDQVATLSSSLSSLTASTSSLLSSSLQPIRSALKPLQILGDDMGAVQRRLTVAEEEGRRARVRQEEDWAMLRQWMDKIREERDQQNNERRTAAAPADSQRGSERDEEIERSKLRWKWIEDERRDKEREDKRERDDRQRSLADDRHGHSQQVSQLVEEARDGLKRAIREQCDGWERKVREVVREEWRREREDGKQDAMRLTLERVERRLDEEGECYRHVSSEVRDVKDGLYQLKQHVSVQLAEVRAAAQRAAPAAATAASPMAPQTIHIHNSSSPPPATPAAAPYAIAAQPAAPQLASAASTAAGVSELLAVMRAQGLLPSHNTAGTPTYPLPPAASPSTNAVIPPHTQPAATPATLPPLSTAPVASSAPSIPIAASAVPTAQRSSITAFAKPLDVTDVLTGKPAQPSPSTHSSPPSSRTSRHASLTSPHAVDALTAAAQQQRDKAAQEERMRQASLAVEQRIAAEQAKAAEDDRKRREADEKLQTEMRQQAKEREAQEQREREEKQRVEMEQKVKADRLKAEMEEKAKAEKRAQEERERAEKHRLADEEKRKQADKVQAEAASKAAAAAAALPTAPVAAAIPSSAPWLQEDSAELSVLARNLPIVARSEKRTTISLVLTTLPSSAHLPFRSLDVTNDTQLHTAGQYDVEHTLLLAPISSFAPDAGLQCRLAVIERSRDGVDECVAVCVLDVSEVWKRKGTFFPLSVTGETSWQQQQLTSKRTSLMIKLQHASGATINALKGKNRAAEAVKTSDDADRTAASSTDVGNKPVVSPSVFAPLAPLGTSAAGLPAIVRATPTPNPTAASKLDRPPTVPSTGSSGVSSSSPSAQSSFSSSPSSSTSSSFAVKNSSASPSQSSAPPAVVSATSRAFSFNQPPTTTTAASKQTAVSNQADSDSSSEEDSDDEVEVTRSSVQSSSSMQPTTPTVHRSLMSPTPPPSTAQTAPSTILSVMRQTAGPSPAPVVVAKPTAAVRASSDSDSSSSDDDDDTPAPAPVSRRAATVGITVRAVPRPAPAPTSAPAAAPTDTKIAESKVSDKPANTTAATSTTAAATQQPATTATPAPKATPSASISTLSSSLLAAVTGKQQPAVDDKKPSSLLPAPPTRPAFTPAPSFASLRGLPPAAASASRPQAAAVQTPAGRAPAFGGNAKRELSDDELSIEANDDDGADLELDFDDDEEQF